MSRCEAAVSTGDGYVPTGRDDGPIMDMYELYIPVIPFDCCYSATWLMTDFPRGVE